MSGEIGKHAPLHRQKDWETPRPEESAEVAPGFGATISARLIRQAAKNANQTQSDFVREAAIRAVHEQAEGATAAVTAGANIVPAGPQRHGPQIGLRPVLTEGQRAGRVAVEEGR